MRDLLPSSSMVKDLSQEFGIPVSQEELTDAKLLATSPQPTPNDGNIQRQSSTLPEEIQTHQEKYLQWRNNMLLKNQDHKDSLVQVGVLSPLHAEAPWFPAASSNQWEIRATCSSGLGHWGTVQQYERQGWIMLEHLLLVPLTLAVLLKYETEWAQAQGTCHSPSVCLRRTVKSVTSCLKGMGTLSCLSSIESKLACRRNHGEETIEDGEAGKVIKDHCCVAWMAKDIVFPKVSRKVLQTQILEVWLESVCSWSLFVRPHPIPCSMLHFQSPSSPSSTLCCYLLVGSHLYHFLTFEI